jgi:adenylate kinase
MALKVLFLAGIHGVGKSYLADKLCKRYDLYYVSASQLIQKHIDCSLGKAVVDVARNQELLVHELNKLVVDKDIILLDGHFTLIDSLGEIVNISQEIFKDISPFLIVILVNSVEKISAQILKRDKLKVDLNLLSIHQERECAYAVTIGSLMNIPILKIDMGAEVENIISIIGQYIRR